jgi:hypothetical protein
MTKMAKNGKKKFSKKTPRLEFFRGYRCKFSHIKIVFYMILYIWHIRIYRIVTEVVSIYSKLY